MPVIRQLIAETSAGGVSPSRGANAADFAAAAEMGDLGRAIQGSTAILDEHVTREDVSNVRAAMAKARADWTVAFQERANNAKPGDPNFAAQFQQDFTDYVQKGRDVATTVAGQRTYDQLATELGGHFREKAGLFQIASAGEKAKLDFTDAQNKYGSSLISDPTQYASVLAQATSDITDPNGRYAAIPASARERLALTMKDHLAKSFVQGLIDNGAPELARKQLMDGKLDDVLNPADKQRLVKEADTGIRAKEADARLKAAEDEKARKEAVEAGMQQFLSRIYTPSKENGGRPSYKEIMASPMLDSQHKEHLIVTMERRAREAENDRLTRNNAEVGRLWGNMIAADGDPSKQFNVEEVRQAYRDGKINYKEEMFLEDRFRGLRDGSTNTFEKDFSTKVNDVKRALTGNLHFTANPGGALDAANRVTQDALALVERYRKENRNPRDILNMDNKESPFHPSNINTYLPGGSALATAAAQAAQGARSGVGTPLTAVNAKGETVVFKDGKWQKP